MIELRPKLEQHETVLAWATAPDRNLAEGLLGNLASMTLYDFANSLVGVPLSAATSAVLGQDFRRAGAVEVDQAKNEAQLPWAALVTDYSLGIRFVREATQRVYKEARVGFLDVLVWAYAESAPWKGPKRMTENQRFDAISEALPTLIFPENIEQHGMWLPEELHTPQG
jgi:hypothetical protein